MSVIASACSIIDPHNMIGRQMGEAVAPPTEFVPSPPPATLDAEARGAAVDFVWQTISERYHDAALNGVDWTAVGQRYRRRRSAPVTTMRSGTCSTR